jgi:replication-dependent DNA damage repair protein MMS1
VVGLQANLSPQDHFVQIRELQPDGQLQNVLRRSDFGSRIRNATVIGSVPDSALKGEKNDSATDVGIKSEDIDVIMDVTDDFPATTSTTALPPQMLVLALECGDTVFLWICAGQDGTLEFNHSRFPTPTSQLVPPGFHIAVDPSSRYMALACAERSFVVYQLDSLKSLHEQYRLGEPLTPVISYRLRSVQGVIHQMQFLYPTPGYDQHVILLLIIVKDSTSRLVIYEWELGDNLKDVFAEEKQGYRMAKGDRVPLLVIPLTVNSAFITISEDQITVHSGHLHGSLEQYQLVIEDESPPTASHHGRNKPLWTAWARPFRLSEFFKTHDCLYLAREDGVVYLFETDSDMQTTATLYMEKFDCSISTAFSCLYDQDIDVLALGGDSSPGAIWKVGSIALASPFPHDCC